MFCDIDRKMLESVFNFIDMKRRREFEMKFDTYDMIDGIGKRILELEESVERLAQDHENIEGKISYCRKDLEQAIRPDLDCIKKKIGADTDVNGDEKENDENKKEIRLDLWEHYREMDKILTRVEDIERMMFGVQDSVKMMHEAFDMIFPLLVKRCGKGGDGDADDDDGRNPSLSAIIDTSIDVCRLEERMESINGKLDRFMRMFKEGVADAVEKTSEKPERRPGRRRKDA